MQIQIATPDTPPPPYWERLDDGQVANVEFVASGDLYHVEDPNNRRIVEGWCSLGGVDWEDEEILSTALPQAVEVYARKNPVILWDHKREFPIGQLLEWEVSERGLFVRFRILDASDFDDPDSEILKKCNEVWGLVRRGIVRGLSWNGRARKRHVWSHDLRQWIKQSVEILMSEITVTPVQVHPGAKITGVNTLSKALEICKALRLGDKGEPMDPIKAAQEAQAAYVAALKALPDGATLPSELVENHEAVNKALGIEPPADLSEAINKALSPLQNKIAQLESKLGGPAPLRNRVGEGNDGANGRPGERNGAEVFYENISKALEIGGDVRDGKAKRGTGERLFLTGPDLMGMYLVANDCQLNWKRSQKPDISFGPGAHALMNAQQ